MKQPLKFILLYASLWITTANATPFTTFLDPVSPPPANTGWKTFTVTFPQTWHGWLTLGVSDAADQFDNSSLFLDNFRGSAGYYTNTPNNGGTALTPLERTLEGGIDNWIADYNAHGSTGVTSTFPPDSSAGHNLGNNVIRLNTFDGYSGLNIVGQQNTHGENGIDGSIIRLFINAANPGTDLVFDWAFTSNEPITGTNRDFAFIDLAGIPGYGSINGAFAEVDADPQVNVGSLPEASNTLVGPDVSAVPVPAAIWLMGSALMGLLGFRRKEKN